MYFPGVQRKCEIRYGPCERIQWQFIPIVYNSFVSQGSKREGSFRIEYRRHWRRCQAQGFRVFGDTLHEKRIRFHS